jgi:probable rRNA maturation factor
MLEINNTTKQKINLPKIQKITDKFLITYKKFGWEVSLAIVGDARMKRLNREYRHHDKVTDVLSWPATSGQSSRQLKYLGEIVIDINEAQRTGKYREMLTELGLDPRHLPAADYIFYFLLAHGLLHLLGYDDGTTKERLVMLKKGQVFLQQALAGK